ncbi:hypothetical protein C8J57DRAFT_1656818 [Mycena rebaudengoi]|nr:hypothetical protein C8J57DRAFT_1656818 [Mycena rebaudengoi]
MLTPRILAPVALLLNILSVAAVPVGSGGTGAGAAIGGLSVDNGGGSGGTGMHGISIGGRGADSGVGAGGTGVVADVWGTGVGTRGVLEGTWGTGVGTNAIAIVGRDAAKPDYFEVEFEDEGVQMLNLARGRLFENGEGMRSVGVKWAPMG